MKRKHEADNPLSQFKHIKNVQKHLCREMDRVACRKAPHYLISHPVFVRPNITIDERHCLKYEGILRVLTKQKPFHDYRRQV